jgi:signal transduction histidine kinase
MTTRRRSILAVLAAVVATLPSPLIGWRTGHLLSASHGLPQVIGFLLPGVLAVAGRPDNRAARRLFALGMVMAVGFSVGSTYSAYLTDHAVPAWGHWLVLLLQALDLGSGALVLALLAVFPDGVYQREVERHMVWIGAGYLLAVLTLEHIAAPRLSYPGTYIWSTKITADNPSAGFGLATLGRAAWIGYQAGFLLLVLTGIVLLVLRFRRSSAPKRGQIAWPLVGAALTVVWVVIMGALSTFLHHQPDWLVYVLYAPSAMAIPLAIGLGILRGNVLDVDVLVRRSVAFGALWVVVTGVCVGVALGLGLLAGRTVPVAVAIGLAVAATLVAEPVRRWLEKLSERLVFGRQASVPELIAALGARLDATTDVRAIADTVATDVLQALRAAWVQVVLDERGQRVVGTAGTPTPGAEPEAAVHLVRSGRRIGEITCGPRWDGTYSTADRQLLQSLAGLAVLAIHNAQLVAELEDSLEDLRASRRRIVAAHDEGRRRLEQDLHDGVQQELVALLAQMGLVQNQLRRDPELAGRTLELAHRAAQDTLLAVQEMARGIHPTLLADHGLVAAIEDRASRMPIPTHVQAKQVPRLRAEVEQAAYFVVAEALGNVLKHARASQAEVLLETPDPAMLRISVRDDGSGFDVERAAQRGLLGLRDRVEAQGGALTVTSGRGAGTCLTATLNLEVAGHA